MAAYDLAPRFSSRPSCPKVLDTGTYNLSPPHFEYKQLPNKIPFLSKTDRITLPLLPIWCDKIYNADCRRKIPNCSAFKFKLPRFAYGTQKSEQLNMVQTKIDITKSPHAFVCQGKVRRRIFKGRTPRSTYGDGISVVPRGHLGFKTYDNGSKKRLIKKYQPTDFYNCRIRMATDFYMGCKWSNRTSERTKIFIPEGPRPGDYDITPKPPSSVFVFNEKLRACRKHTTRQPRYMEMHVQREIAENKPGPSHYDPFYPKCNLQFSEPKTERFPCSQITGPGPAHYNIKRAFDSAKSLNKISRVPIRLAPFGCREEILKRRLPDGPGPTSNDPKFDHHCIRKSVKPPFNTSSQRFKDPALSESDDEEKLLEEFMVEFEKENYKQLQKKSQPLWSFESKTPRFKPLHIREKQSSPTDFLKPKYDVKRSAYPQNCVPFGSGEERFRPWYNWMPLQGMEELPEPGAYKLRNIRCYPAVRRGPVTRARRFSAQKSDTPPPGTYTIRDGIETILSTHNVRLMKNIQKKYKFKWTQLDKEELPFKEKYSTLLQKMIDIIESSTKVPSVKSPDESKQKMLKWFLYSHKVPFYT